MAGKSTEAVVFPQPRTTRIEEVPLPEMGHEELTVHIQYSCISSGTERWCLTDCMVIPGTEPLAFPHPAHAHDADEIFFIFGSNPLNYYDFDAEIEISFGEEGEKHIVDSTSIVYMPKGLVHGPIAIKKVNKPFQWMHVLFMPKYDMTVGDVSQHPKHPREQYTPEEIKKFKGG